MFCGNCGQKLDESKARFCPRCGTPIKIPVQQDTPATFPSEEPRQQAIQPAQQAAQPVKQQVFQQVLQSAQQQAPQPSSGKPLSKDLVQLICKISSFVCLGLILLFTMLNVGGHENGFSTFGGLFKSSYSPSAFCWQLWFVGTIILVGFNVFKQVTGVFNFKHSLKLVAFTIFSMFAVGSSMHGRIVASFILDLIFSIIAVVPVVIYGLYEVNSIKADPELAGSDDVYGLYALDKIRNTKITPDLIFKICGCICCIFMLFASISLYNMPNSFSFFIDIIKKATGSYGKYTLESGTWHIWILGSLILGIIINLKAVLGHNYHAALNYISLFLSIAAIIVISIATKGEQNVMAIIWVAILALGSIIFFALVKDKDEEVDELDSALNGPIIPANAENPLL
ncbi:MAG: zinc ribbon domain-containing protein [Fibrobacter sp.]|nr:zinc ribbon domain-containing protein [Fibrobacter sp.]